MEQRKVTEKAGERMYPALPKNETLRVTANNGREYTITRITPVINDKEFPAWIFEPEGAETDEVTVNAYGFGENAAADEPEAHEMAALGEIVALHETPRTLAPPSPRELMRNPARLGRFARLLARDIKNPLILPSEAISSTMDAVEAYSGQYNKFRIKARSMGGLTGVMAAVREEQVNALYLDGSAGLVLRNAMANHLDKPWHLISDEVIPAAKALKENGPEDMMGRMLDHVKDDPTRMLREMAFLVLIRPDISRGLRELKERNVTVVAVSHELDQFFKEHDMEHALQRLVSRGLITYYHQSKGTKHVNGLIAPQHNAQLYHDTLRIAAEKKAAQPIQISSSYRRRRSGLLIPTR